MFTAKDSQKCQKLYERYYTGRKFLRYAVPGENPRRRSVPGIGFWMPVAATT